MRLTLGLGIGAGGGGGVGAPVEWSPASLTSAALLADYDIRQGVTLRNAMTDHSATGDAIALSGTLGPYSPPPALRVDITTGGAPDAGKFRVSLNSGHDYIDVAGSYDITIPAGLTYAIPGTAINLVFDDATFNANAIYTSQIETWSDQSGNGHTATRNGSNRGPSIVGAGRTNNGFGRAGRGIAGRIAATSNILELMDLPEALATALAGGTGNEYHVLALAQYDSVGATAQTIVGCGNTSSATQFVDIGQNGAGAYRHNVRNNANQLGTATYGASDLRAHLHNASYVDDPVKSGQSDGGTAGTNTTAHGAMTFNVGSLFGRRRNTIDLRAAASVVRVLLYDGKLSDEDLATATAQLRSIHDVAIPKAIRVGYMGDSFFDAARGNGAAPNVMIHGNDLVTVVNAAASGAVVGDLVAQGVTVDANYSGGADGNILFIHCMMNDSQGASPAATIETAMRAQIAARQAVGWTVYLDTLRDREDAEAGYAAKRATLNAAIRSDAMGADGYWDSDLDAPGTFADALWYADDGVGHPTGPEASREADLMEVVYRAYVAAL